MNKQLLVIALAAVVGACAVPAAAFARQAAAASPATDGQQATQTSAAQPSAMTGTKHAVPPVDSRMCVRDTGSHLRPPKGKCLPVAGNSYTQEDIRRTGAMNVGQALQMLDPSVRVSGGH